jgi:hypothetical protein
MMPLDTVMLISRRVSLPAHPDERLPSGFGQMRNRISHI